MKRWITIVIALLSVAACDKEASESTEGAATAEAVQEETERAVEEVAEAAKYDKEMRKKGCEILTAEMVSEALGVPADELQQMKMMGCQYTWDKDGQTVHARLGSIRAHENTGVAKKWFENATKGMTAEETREAMAEITEKAKKDEWIDTDTKKKGMDKVGGIMGEMGSFTFADVDGIGDEARENVDDGELWVRVGNLTFIVNAYKGPQQPPPTAKMEKGKMKEYMRAVQKEQREWTRKTLKQRQEASRKIAKLVIAKL